jgi:hypothetical protein
VGVLATSRSKQSRPLAEIVAEIASKSIGPLARPSRETTMGPAGATWQKAAAYFTAVSGVNSEPTIPRKPLILMIGSGILE